MFRTNLSGAIKVLYKMSYMKLATGERIRLTATLLPQMFTAPEDIDQGTNTLDRVAPVKSTGKNKHQTENRKGENVMNQSRIQTRTP